MTDDSPQSYARQLATYITDASTIRARTWNEFARSPTLSTIQAMIDAEKRKARAIGEPKDSDGEDWQPRTFVPKAKPRRVRDYIRISEFAPEKREEPQNPFLQTWRLTRALAESVARDFDISPSEIMGDRKFNRLVDARSVVINLLARKGHPYAEIGRRLGKDHSTIIHACRHFDIYQRRNDTVGASWRRHLALMAEADREHATRTQDNDAEAVCAA